MDFFQELFLPPSADHLHLIKFLLMVIYFIHLPFIALVIGGTFYSLWFNVRDGGRNHPIYGRLAYQVLEALVFNKWAGLVLGVLPLLVIILISGQIFYDAPIAIVPFLSYLTIFTAVGLSLVYAYQASFRWRENNYYLHLLFGVAGLGMLLLAYLLFSGVTSLQLDPGRWFLIRKPTQLLFSWNVMARFVQFTTAALAFSGAAVLFFFFHWQGGRRGLEENYATYLRNFAMGTALFFTLLQPFFLFWNLITLPSISLSEAVFLLAILVIMVLAWVGLKLWRMVQEKTARRGVSVFVLYLLAFVLMVVTDHFALENAIENHSALLISRAEEVQSRLEAEREARRTSAIKVDLELGKKVYLNQCITCHRFDQQVVGPAYNQVLPKYLDRQEELVDFVRKPRKIDPALPPMPQLGLKESEIRSVVAYLLKTFREQQNNSTAK